MTGLKAKSLFLKIIFVRFWPFDSVCSCVLTFGCVHSNWGLYAVRYESPFARCQYLFFGPLIDEIINSSVQNVFFFRLHEAFSSNSFSEHLETLVNLKESTQMLTF